MSGQSAADAKDDAALTALVGGNGATAPSGSEKSAACAGGGAATAIADANDDAVLLALVSGAGQLGSGAAAPAAGVGRGAGGTAPTKAQDEAASDDEVLRALIKAPPAPPLRPAPPPPAIPVPVAAKPKAPRGFGSPTRPVPPPLNTSLGPDGGPSALEVASPQPRGPHDAHDDLKLKTLMGMPAMEDVIDSSADDIKLARMIHEDALLEQDIKKLKRGRGRAVAEVLNRIKRLREERAQHGLDDTALLEVLKGDEDSQSQDPAVVRRRPLPRIRPIRTIAVRADDLPPGSLTYFAAIGDAASCRYLCDQARDIGDSVLVDSPDVRGRTPLHHAAFEGNAEVAEILLQAGADVLCRDADGRTPFHVVAFRGHIDVARFMVGASVCRQRAASLARLRTLRKGIKDPISVRDILLEYLRSLEDLRNALFRAEDRWGFSAIHYATRDAYVGCIYVLELALKSCYEFSEGEGDAVMQERRFHASPGEPLVQTLMGFLSSCQAEDLCREHLLRAQELRMKLVDGRDTQGLTPLHYAAAAGNYRVVQLLLGLGADLFARWWMPAVEPADAKDADDSPAVPAGELLSFVPMDLARNQPTRRVLAMHGVALSELDTAPNSCMANAQCGLYGRTMLHAALFNSLHPVAAHAYASMTTYEEDSPILPGPGLVEFASSALGAHIMDHSPLRRGPVRNVLLPVAHKLMGEDEDAWVLFGDDGDSDQFMTVDLGQERPLTAVGAVIRAPAADGGYRGRMTWECFEVRASRDVEAPADAPVLGKLDDCDLRQARGSTVQVLFEHSVVNVRYLRFAFGRRYPTGHGSRVLHVIARGVDPEPLGIVRPDSSTTAPGTASRRPVALGELLRRHPCSDPLVPDANGWMPLHLACAFGLDTELALLIERAKQLHPSLGSKLRGITKLGHSAAGVGRSEQKESRHHRDVQQRRAPSLGSVGGAPRQQRRAANTQSGETGRLSVPTASAGAAGPGARARRTRASSAACAGSGRPPARVEGGGQVEAPHGSHSLGALMGRTPAHLAAQCSGGKEGLDGAHIKCLCLLERESLLDFHAEDARGFTPLLSACAAGSVTAAKWLLRRGSDDECYKTDRRMQNVLHLAAAKGHRALVRMLVRYDADTSRLKEGQDWKGRYPDEVFPVALARDSTAPNSILSDYGTPWEAARFGDVQRLHDALRATDAGVDELSPGGWTAVMYAARGGHAGVVRSLLALRCHCEAPRPPSGGLERPDVRRTLGQGPLHLAAAAGHAEVVDLLARAGCNCGGLRGRRPLATLTAGTVGTLAAPDSAAHAGSCPMEARSEEGLTPLMYACRAGRTEAMMELLQHRANPRAMSSAGPGPDSRTSNLFQVIVAGAVSSATPAGSASAGRHAECLQRLAEFMAGGGIDPGLPVADCAAATVRMMELAEQRLVLADEVDLVSAVLDEARAGRGDIPAPSAERQKLVATRTRQALGRCIRQLRSRFVDGPPYRPGAGPTLGAGRAARASAAAVDMPSEEWLAS